MLTRQVRVLRLPSDKEGGGREGEQSQEAKDARGRQCRRQPRRAARAQSSRDI